MSIQTGMCMFGSVLRKIDFDWIYSGWIWVKCKVIYIWIHLCKSWSKSIFKM